MSCMLKKKKKMCPAYVSKLNSNHEKQVILLIITLSKKLLALLREITSKHHIDFNCLNFLHSFATENRKHESHKRVRENKDFCNFVVPSKDTKILFNTDNLTKFHLLFM